MTDRKSTAIFIGLNERLFTVYYTECVSTYNILAELPGVAREKRQPEALSAQLHYYVGQLYFLVKSV